MNYLKQIITFLFVVYNIFICQFVSASEIDYGPVFFMGEDIVHLQGFVVAVNEINVDDVKGGFSNSVLKRDLCINLTVMNNSDNDYTINTMNDFSLLMGEAIYNPYKNKDGRYQNDDINISAHTQSRLDIKFRIENKHYNLFPTLIITIDGSKVRIICNQEMAKVVSLNNFSNVPLKNIAEVIRIMIEGGRLTSAKQLCESALITNNNNCLFLMLMAKIYYEIEERYQTDYYLRKVDVNNIRSPEEAEEVAKFAVKLGFNSIALSILASYESSRLLGNEQKCYLARLYYYENNLDEALNILNDLIRSGYDDTNVNFTIGNVYNKKRDYHKAIYYWEKAVELDSNNMEALYNLGVGHYKTGSLNNAKKYWSKVTEFSPKTFDEQQAYEASKNALRDIGEY